MRFIACWLGLWLGVAHAKPGAEFVIDPAVFEDVGAVARSARIVPHYQGGRPQGFKLVGVRPGKVASLAGFRSGDVLKAVNGTPLGTVQAVMDLQAQIKGQTQLVVDVERRGQPIQWTIKLVKGAAPASTSPDLAKAPASKRGPDASFVGHLDQEMARDPQRIVRAAWFLPQFDEGAMTGFRVRRIRRELRATGLRSGDLITAIDDIALTSLDALTRLKTVARRRKQVVVHVNRLGTQHQWPIKIVKGPVPEMVEPPDAVPAAKGDPEVHVLKAEALADPDWTRQVRVIPHYKDGRPQGFKLVGIRPGSVFRQIGLRSGDVLKAIDGQPMDSPAKALEAYSTIQKTRAFVLSIERRGRPKTLSVRIEGQLPEDLKIPADRVPVQHMQLEGQLEVRMNGPAHGVGEGALEVVMRDARLVKGDSQWNLGVVRYAATLQRGRYVGRAQLTGGDLQGEGEVQYRGGFSRYTARIDVQASPAIADSLTDAFDKERKATLVCWSQHHCEFKALGAEIPRRTRRKRRTPAPR